VTETADEREVAAEYLSAELEIRKLNPLRAVLAAALGAVGASGGEDLSEYDLVVRRISTGAEVVRTRADIGDPHFLLAQVQLDLETKTVVEFVEEWRRVE
jgi:hypothetical protein